MAKTYLPYVPTQSFLLPPNPREWLPEDHLAMFIDQMVGGLDLGAIEAHYDAEVRGAPPHNPRMMVKVIFYAYTQGLHSARKIERACIENIPYRVLAGNVAPDHSCFNRFRSTHIEALADLFTQSLRLAQAQGLVRVGHVSLDGTKIKANASRHKAMSYGRMTKEEKRLRDEIKKTLEEAQRLDERENEEFGDEKENRLGPDFNTKEKRLKKIQEGMRRIEEEVRKKTGKPEALPDEKAQTNFTDPESRIMPTSSPKGAFDQAFNAQLVANQDGWLLAIDVSQSSADSPHLPALMEQAIDNTGIVPEVGSFDAGYFSAPNLEYLKHKGIDAYIPPDRQKHGAPVAPAPRGRIPAHLSPADRMRRKLRTKKGRAIYARRKAIAEPPIGLLKRVLGFRRFNMRGHTKARGEGRFVAAVYNVMKWYWSGTPAPTAG